MACDTMSSSIRTSAYIRHALQILSTPGQRRHLGTWTASLVQGQPNYGLPWMTFDAIQFLRERVPSSARVLEYGSGASTIFWMKRGAHCISIEHDVAFHRTLSRRLGASATVDYRLRPPEPAVGDNAQDPSEPLHYRSAAPEYHHCTFRAYASEADRFPDDTFDVVVVDGRARPSCILHGAPKVKAGGLLVLDNADRPYYTARTGHFLQGFKRHAFPGVGPYGPWLWETDIYERPI